MHLPLKLFMATTLCAGVFASQLALAPAAQACGGFFCSLQQPVEQAAERILFAKDGEDMVAHVQIQYSGPAENFSWIVPVPTAPELSVGSDAVFQALRDSTRPQFNIDITTVGECAPETFAAEGPLAAPTAEPTVAPSAAVTVISEQQVGPFESVVLTGDDPETVKQWLRDNGYDVPPNVDPLLNPYIENDMPLLALKLKKGRTAGDLQPIAMRYKADKPMIPIQLTAVAAEEDMDVQVWVLGEQRAIPMNYPHVKINEARVNWFSGGSNYRSLVTDAMNEAGGQGFVTDYAGNSALISTQNFRTDNIDLEAIARLTDPMAFARELQAIVGFDQWPAFAARYIPKPGLLAEIEDDVFYNQLENYAAALNKAGVQADGPGAAQELEETRVKPLKELGGLFGKHPYLTALYTTLSPQEMTRDPVFDFNGDLPEVSQSREAKGVRQCSPEVSFSQAPITITTPSGLTYTVNGSFQSEPQTPEPLPAAMVIQSLGASGPAVDIKNDQQNIQTRLNTTLVSGAGSSATPPVGQPPSEPAKPEPEVQTGAGCACHSPNTPQPASQGAGEGLSYALGLLGFLSWRKRRKK